MGVEPMSPFYQNDVILFCNSDFTQIKMNKNILRSTTELPVPHYHLL